MRILYLSNIPISRNEQKGYNGGGWIFSLIREVKKQPDMQVAVGFFGQYDEKFEVEGMTCYRIKTLNGGSLLKKICYRIKSILSNNISLEEKSWPYYENRLSRVVNDFNPDVIHIFGSELQWGLVAGVTDVPVVLHIQGILNPYRNALLPPFIGWNSFGISPLALYKNRLTKRSWESNCYREREIYRRVKNYMGRTTWDERVTKCFNQSANYYYCGEILRDDFYVERQRNIPETLNIVTTISGPTYKGYDMILKTADILKNCLGLKFSWKVFGNVNPKLFEQTFNIKASDVDVCLKGVVEADTLQKELLACTCYMHPSYIDNSPNSLCEAQMLGVPVVACNVGGIASLIDDDKTGALVPANDPYQAAWVIWELFKDKDRNIQMGENARAQAQKRHSKEVIAENIITIYKNINNSLC